MVICKKFISEAAIPLDDRTADINSLATLEALMNWLTLLHIIIQTARETDRLTNEHPGTHIDTDTQTQTHTVSIELHCVVTHWRFSLLLVRSTVGMQEGKIYLRKSLLKVR